MESAPRARLWAIGIACAYIVLAVLQSYATRLGWGPDEPAHLIYVQSLALDGRMPRLDGAAERYRRDASVTHQAQHPPAYYALAAAAYRLLHIRSVAQAYRRLRFFSILLGAVTLLLHWRLVKAAFDAPDQRIAAFACLAFLPMFTYMTAVVNNDALVVLAFAGALQALARCIGGKSGRFGPAEVGLWTALGLATKESAVALVPAVVIGLLLPREGRSVKRRAADAAVALAIALAPAALWEGRNVLVYGTPFVYAYVQPAFTSPGQAFAYPFAAWALLAEIAQHTFTFLWAPVWGITEPALARAYLGFFGVIAVLGAAGLLLLATDLLKRRRPVPAQEARMLGLSALLALVVYVGVVRYVMFVDLRALQGGRYLIAVWPALSLLGTAGASTLLRGARTAGLAALVCLWLAADVTCVWAVGRTYGAW